MLLKVKVYHKLQVNELPTPGDHCLPYWIAAYDAESNILAAECLKIRPTWMGDLK